MIKKGKEERAAEAISKNVDMSYAKSSTRGLDDERCGTTGSSSRQGSRRESDVLVVRLHDRNTAAVPATLDIFPTRWPRNRTTSPIFNCFFFAPGIPLVAFCMHY